MVTKGPFPYVNIHIISAGVYRPTYFILCIIFSSMGMAHQRNVYFLFRKSLLIKCQVKLTQFKFSCVCLKFQNFFILFSQFSKLKESRFRFFFLLAQQRISIESVRNVVEGNENRVKKHFLGIWNRKKEKSSFPFVTGIAKLTENVMKTPTLSEFMKNILRCWINILLFKGLICYCLNSRFLVECSVQINSRRPTFNSN